MKSYNAIGVMSGSSLDGVDIVAIQFNVSNDNNIETWDFIAGKIAKYPVEIQHQLTQIPHLSGRELWKLHVDLGHCFGRMVLEFMDEYQVNPDFIGSHGHTAFHHPDQGFTCQLGDGASIMSETGVPVIVDFRSDNLAYGGQGAPLAPLIDRELFPSFSYFLNLGGIANMHIVDMDHSTAFDVCLCNQLLNYFSTKLNYPFDPEGRLSEEGKINPSLLVTLDNWDYYSRPLPKSLDNNEIKSFIHYLESQHQIDIKDILATSVAHIAQQIARSFIPFKDRVSRPIFTTGGGAFNTQLINQLNAELPEGYFIHRPAKYLIDFKEAILIGLAGMHRWLKQPIFYQDLVGSDRNTLGGAVYWPS